MMKTRRFPDAKSLTTTAICPVCESRSLDLRLLGDPADKCLYTAVCENCGIPFHVEAEPRPGAIGSMLSRRGCPECGHEGAAFAMVCRSPSRSSFRIVACTSCGHPFTTALAATGRVASEAAE